MVKLVEIVQTFKDQYKLREIFINPAHVVYLREDITMSTRLTEGKLPDGLDTRQTFTKLQVHNGTTGSEFVVVGPPSIIENKLKGNQQELLRG
jgi:hypothetical protein